MFPLFSNEALHNWSVGMSMMMKEGLFVYVLCEGVATGRKNNEF